MMEMIDKTLEGLKKRLLMPLPGREAQFRMAPSYRPGMDDTAPKQLAGVTILLYKRNNELFFPLIERPQYNGAHSGQISFPGGRKEDHDRNLTVTALRECEEEIGTDASKILVLGGLSQVFIPVSKFDVHPTIGYFQETPIFKPQASEVVAVIEVPLNLILDDHIVEQKSVLYNGIDEVIPYFNISNKMVWGATAMILSEFIQIWKESQNI